MISLSLFFVRNYKFTFVITIFCLIFGVLGLLRTNSESYPSVDFAMASINANYDGATPSDIETRITKPIEDELRSVSGLKDVRSISQPGSVSIFVRADIDNVVVDDVMADLQRAVDRVVDLPSDMRDKPNFQEIKSEEFPVIEVAIIGENRDRSMEKVADLLKEEIEDNPSVLSVRITGYRDRQFQIEIDPIKMERLHIGVDEIIRKIELRNRNVPGGKLENPGQQKLIRLEAKVSSKEDLENIVLRSSFSGPTIMLKDVASILDGSKSAKTLTYYNGQESMFLIVTKKAGADTIQMVDDIDDKIARFEGQFKNQFKFVVYNNEANEVKDKLSVLGSNAFFGLLLVMIFLMIFLPGKIGVVASMSLPISVMVTLGFLPVLGMNLNAITILALVIALGMLVDNSVVIAENYTRLRGDGRSAYDACMESIQTLFVPISATVFTTIAAFVPMLVTTGIMGQFIKYIPIIVSLSLFICLVECFFLLPMRLNFIDGNLTNGSKKIESQVDDSAKYRSGWFDKVSSSFESATLWLIRRRYFTFMIFSGLMLVSFLMIFVFNRLMLFPSDQSKLYVTRIELDRSATLEETGRTVKEISQKMVTALAENADHIVTRAGTSQAGMADPQGKEGDNVGMILTYVNDFTRFNVTDDEVIGKMSSVQVGPDVVEITHTAQANGPPVGEAVNVTLRSNNQESLKHATDLLVGKMKENQTLHDVMTDEIISNDEVYIDIDYDKVDRLGVDVATIGGTVRSAVSGKVVSTVNLANKEVELYLRLDKTNRRTIDDLKILRVMDGRGNLIPLGQIAQFRVEGGTPFIKRFDFKRSVTVTSKIHEDKTTSFEANNFVKDVFKAIQESDPEVSMVFGGEGESTSESLDSLFNALILSLIGIFALLVLIFNSFLKPFVIMTTIPLGLFGFSVAFWAHDKPISFLAMIGIIGLGGIIVNSGIILISFIDQLRAESQDSLEVILARASKLRLRAVVVSSITTISGLMPTAYGIGGSDAFLMPMTLAMGWGLTSGTILTLVWVPCAYAIVEDFTGLFSKKRIGDLDKKVPTVGSAKLVS